jgi:pyruvate dehydrogenase E1 component beta subunit
VQLAREAAKQLELVDVSAEVIDLRTINPLETSVVVASAERTGRLLAVDVGWTCCGLAGEIIARVVEELPPAALRAAPRRVTLQDAPAPTSGPLEQAYYPSVDAVVQAAGQLVERPAVVPLPRSLSA